VKTTDKSPKTVILPLAERQSTAALSFQVRMHGFVVQNITCSDLSLLVKDALE